MSRSLVLPLVVLVLTSSGITYAYWSIDWAFWAAAEHRTVQLPTPFGYWTMDPWVWWGVNYFLMLPLIVLLALSAYAIGSALGDGRNLAR